MPFRLSRERRFVVYLCGHALLFLGLYQVGYTPDAWARLSNRAARSFKSPTELAVREEGVFALVRAYYRTDSDERLYREYARLVLHGKADLSYIASKQYSQVGQVPSGRAVPYRDVRVEYPPLALLLGMIPPLFVSGDTYLGYRMALGAWLFLLYGVNLGCALWLLRARGLGAATEERVLRASLVFCGLLGNIVATRLDGLVAVFLLCGVIAIEQSLCAEGKVARRAAWVLGVCSALGVLTKIVPGLLIPVALVVWHGSGRRDRTSLMLTALGSGGAVLLGLHGLFWYAFGDGYLATFGYHAARGIQLESSYASILLLASLFGFPVLLDLSFGSSNVESALSPALAALSPWLWLTVTLAVLLLALRARVTEAMPLLTALTLWFTATSKVFSPQYLIWSATLVLLLSATRRVPTLTWLWLAIALLSQVLYPRAYAALKQFSPPLVLVLCLRNLCFVAAALLVTRLALASAQPRTRADSA